MDCHDLKLSVEQAPLSKRVVLDRLYLYVTNGSVVRPEFAAYLASSTTYQEFFDAVYADDTWLLTSLWADWAKLQRKTWLHRFQPKIALENLRLKSDGLPLQFGTGIVLAPTGSRDNVANLYVFDSGAFNAQAADFVTSIGGKFTCADYDFTGIYGMYSYRGSVILEQWEADAEPVRKQ